MGENTYQKVTVDSPLELVASILETAGYVLGDLPEGVDTIVSFAIPHNFGGYCEAVVEFLPGVGMLQMTLGLTRGKVNPLLAGGLLSLLNRLNLLLSGVTFTFDEGEDEEDSDDIEISSVCYVFDEIQLEEHVKLMVRYLEEALKMSLPAVYHYMTQRLRFKAVAGKLVYLGPTYSIDDVLEMVECNRFGRA